MGRGYDQLQNEQGVNLITLLLTICFVVVIAGSVYFRFMVIKDSQRRKAMRDERERAAK